MYRVTKRDSGITEYKDAATNKMMQESGLGDFEVISFSYNYAAPEGNARSVTVSSSTFANSKYQDANTEASTTATLPLGGSRTEQLHYEGPRLASRLLQKDGKHHGPWVLYGQTIMMGFLIPDIQTSDTMYCYRDGALIQANPCNVESTGATTHESSFLSRHGDGCSLELFIRTGAKLDVACWL